MEIVLSKPFVKKCINTLSKNCTLYLVHVFFITILLYYIFGTKTDLLLLRISQLIGLILFILNMPFLFKNNNFKLDIRFSNFNLILLFTFSSLIMCKIVNKNFYIFDIIYPLLFFGVVVSLIRLKLNYKFTIFLYCFIHLFLFYKFLTQPNPDLWVRGSSNQVSVLLLPITLLFYIEKFRRKENLSVFPAIPPFLLCIIAQGTGGIICSFLLLCVLIYNNIKSKYFVKVVIFTIFVIFLYLVSSKLSLILLLFREFINTFILLSQGTEPRLGVIYFYFSSMGLYELLFGNKVALDQYENMTSLSSHNSFLSIHSSIGFGIFILLFLTLFKTFRLYSSNSKILFFMLAIIVLRGCTDNILYQGHILFSIPFYYILALASTKSKFYI